MCWQHRAIIVNISAGGCFFWSPTTIVILPHRQRLYNIFPFGITVCIQAFIKQANRERETNPSQEPRATHTPRGDSTLPCQRFYFVTLEKEKKMLPLKMFQSKQHSDLFILRQIKITRIFKYLFNMSAKPITEKFRGFEEKYSKFFPFQKNECT